MEVAEDALVESDPDRRFRRLAAAIAHDADPEDVPELELDLRGRTFSYPVRCDDGQTTTRTVAVQEGALEVRPGIGELASGAWGVPLSDDEGWFRLAVSGWDESLGSSAEGSESGWWTITAVGGALPVPPWEVRDYRPPAP